MLNNLREQVLTNGLKAKAAAWWVFVCLLWLVFIIALCVLPAVVIAGWRWFL